MFVLATLPKPDGNIGNEDRKRVLPIPQPIFFNQITFSVTGTCTQIIENGVTKYILNLVGTPNAQ